MSAGRYAKGTTVAPEKSRAEIEGLVRKYGATEFVSGYSETAAFVMFRVKGRGVRFNVSMPKVGYAMDERQAQAEERRLWRCLVLSIKSKLEVVESGIATFEDEFLAHTLLPSGATFAEWAAPQLERIVADGEMPSVLSMPARLALGPGVEE